MHSLPLYRDIVHCHPLTVGVPATLAAQASDGTHTQEARPSPQGQPVSGSGWDSSTPPLGASLPQSSGAPNSIPYNPYSAVQTDLRTSGLVELVELPAGYRGGAGGCWLTPFPGGASRRVFSIRASSLSGGFCLGRRGRGQFSPDTPWPAFRPKQIEAKGKGPGRGVCSWCGGGAGGVNLDLEAER